MQLFYARMSMRGVSGAGREAYQHANTMSFGVGRQQLAFDPGRNLYPVRLEPLPRQRQHWWIASLLGDAKREPCLQRCSWTKHIGGPGDEPIEHRTEALHFALTVRACGNVLFDLGHFTGRWDLQRVRSCKCGHFAIVPVWTRAHSLKSRRRSNVRVVTSRSGLSRLTFSAAMCSNTPRG